MSHPAIYIELQGTTSRVPPRYTPPVSLSCAPHVRPRGPATSWCGIPGFPYAIRNSEFGIPESGIGNRGTGNSHGAVFSLLTT